MYIIFLKPIKSILTLWKAFLVYLLSTVISIFLSSIHSNISLAIKIEENNESISPMIRVVAKPCTGPEPKIYKYHTCQDCCNVTVNDSRIA